jgi:hypothetical protein
MSILLNTDTIDLCGVVQKTPFEQFGYHIAGSYSEG